MDPNFEAAARLASDIAFQVASKAVEGQALGDGRLLELFLELFKMLLPILLQLLNPAT